MQELAKYTPENHPDKKLLTDAFNKISDIALTVNESMKNNQNAKFFETLLETVKGIGVSIFWQEKIFTSESGCFRVVLKDVKIRH